MVSENIFRQKYNLIVFDWDGTLADSHHYIIYCLQQAAIAVGLIPLSNEILRPIIGLAVNQVANYLYPTATLEQQQAFMAQYRYYFVSKNPFSPLYPGVTEVLKTLKAHNKLLAIATNKSTKGLEEALIEHQIKDFFICYRGADIFLPKPHPQMLEDIMTYAGVKPAETIMVGDSIVDMELAQNTKVDAIAVTYGAYSKKELLALRPLAFIDDISQLTMLFG